MMLDALPIVGNRNGLVRLIDDSTVVWFEQWLATSHGSFQRLRNANPLPVPQDRPQERALRQIEEGVDAEPQISRTRLTMLAREGTATSSPAQMRLAITLLTEAQACLQAEQRPPAHIHHRLAVLRYETGLPLDIDLL